MQYSALRCKIDALASNSEDYKKIEAHVVNTKIKGDPLQVMNVYSVHRDVEYKHFTSHIDNQR